MGNNNFPVFNLELQKQLDKARKEAEEAYSKIDFQEIEKVKNFFESQEYKNMVLNFEKAKSLFVNTDASTESAIKEMENILGTSGVPGDFRKTFSNSEEVFQITELISKLSNVTAQEKQELGHFLLLVLILVYFRNPAEFSYVYSALTAFITSAEFVMLTQAKGAYGALKNFFSTDGF